MRTQALPIRRRLRAYPPAPDRERAGMMCVWEKIRSRLGMRYSKKGVSGPCGR